MTANPPLETWTAPFEATLFDRIRPGHFPPVFDQRMAEHPREVVWTSSGLGRHVTRSAEFGFGEIQPHQMGRNQRASAGPFGERVPPALRRR